MSSIINGKKQNDVEELNSLPDALYENIFNVNLIDYNGSNFYFYNLLTKVIFPDSISDDLINEITLVADKPWTTLSYELYGTIQLWWVIYLLNKPDYIFKAQANNTYKYIKPGSISTILGQIKVDKS
jgi:hypothetical protein